jgi:excisionase family DNA binding protein
VREAAGVEPLVTVEEAAEFLGVRVGTVYLWAESERIPSYKVGNLRRFRLSELEAYLHARRTGPSRPSKWDPPGPARQKPVA